MSNNSYWHNPDLTAQQPPVGIGMNMNVLFACGHRGSKTGAQIKLMPKGLQPLLLRCAACNRVRLAA